MIKIEFDAAIIDNLYKAQLNHPNPRVRKKLMAVYLKSLDVEHAAICRICRISWPMLLSYFKEYTVGGINALTEIRHEGHPSKLNDFAKEIKSMLAEHPPATLKEARAKIKEFTGIERSIPQIWSFMRKLGLSTRKVGGVPGKANPEEQEAFKKTNWNRASQRQRREKE